MHFRDMIPGEQHNLRYSMQRSSLTVTTIFDLYLSRIFLNNTGPLRVRLRPWKIQRLLNSANV